MKRNLTIFIILLTLFLIFWNYTIVLGSTTYAIEMWKNKVFPYLFIMIVLIDLLNSLNVANYFKNPSLYIIILSFFSGTPSSSVVISSLYKSGKISKEYANISLIYTSLPNPLFLYTMLISLFNTKKIVITLIVVLYLSNILLYLFYKRSLPDVSFSYDKNSVNIAASIKKGLNTCLFVLGTIIFFLTITNLFIYTFHISKVLSIFLKGILEMTQGLNSLINLSIFGKVYISMFFLAFQGLAIHTQVYYILQDNGLDYNYFLKGRILSSFLVLIGTSLAIAAWECV